MTFKEAKSSGAGPEPPPIMQAPVGFPALSTQRKDTQESLPALQVSVGWGGSSGDWGTGPYILAETREKDIFVAMNTTVDLGVQCFIALGSREHGLTAVLLFFRDPGASFRKFRGQAHWAQDTGLNVKLGSVI